MRIPGVIYFLLLMFCSNCVSASEDVDDSLTFTPFEMEIIEGLGAWSDVKDKSILSIKDDRAARLGKTLFFDDRLSINGMFSCASCHIPSKAFTDGRAVAKAIGEGSRNTPSLLNISDNYWFNWDGSADSIWSQALKVIENPLEFGSHRLHIAYVVASNEDLKTAYQEAFDDVPKFLDINRIIDRTDLNFTLGKNQNELWDQIAGEDQEKINLLFVNVGKALGSYQGFLESYNSGFDKFAASLIESRDFLESEFSKSARRGLKLFIGKAQCVECHSGKLFSNGDFHNIGLPIIGKDKIDEGRSGGIRLVSKDIFSAAGPFNNPNNVEATRRLKFISKPENMLGAFKTPSLRNVAITAPYMHDGRFDTLEQVVDFYSKKDEIGNKQILLGEREATMDLIPKLSEQEIGDLVSFLKTLNSEGLAGEITEKD